MLHRRLLFLACLVAALVAPAAAAQAAVLYPDMQSLPPRDIYLTKADTDFGNDRNVLRFTNTVWNGGEGDLRVFGVVNTATGTAPADQRLENTDGTTTSVNIGSYVIHPQHQHFHYDNWGRYELWTKADWDAWNAAGRPAGQVPPIVGGKTTSCILDEEFIRDIPGTPWPDQYKDGGCDPTKTGKVDTGLSVGWGDTYDHNRYDQWIDFGDKTLADGDYVLRTIADPENKVHESPNKADPSRESIEANEAMTPVKVVGGKVVDQQRPTGTVSINDVRATTSSPNVNVYALGRDDTVVLNSTGTDFASENVKQVRVSNDGATWKQYPYGGRGSQPMTIAWDLTNPAHGGTTAGGTKTVYVQFQDATGKWSATETDTIEYTGGTTPPPPTSSSAYRTRIMGDFPLGYWRLGETSGTAAADERGVMPGVHQGTPTLGVASLLNSDANRAVRFGGAAHTAIQNSSAWLSNRNLTLEAWIRPDSLPANGDFRSVLTQPEAYSIQFNGPRLEFTLISSTGTKRRLLAPVGAIQAGQTYHLMATYNGQEMRLYINGVDAGALAASDAVSVTGAGLYIGAWWGASEQFVGTIDDVAVYGATLTGLQAKQHHDTGVTTVVGVSTPTNLAATAKSSSQIDLSWTDNSANESGFVIERATNSTFTNPTEIAKPTDATTHSDTGLVAGTTYWYRVKAVTATDSSGWSGAQSATTTGAVTPPPAAPSALAATATSPSQINVTWTDNATDETGYVLERSTSSTFTSPTTTTLAAGATSASVTGLSASTQYFFRVKAVRDTVSSASSNTADATTQAVPPPAAPSALAATATSSSQVNLTWTDNATDETGYVLERSTSSTFTSPTTTTLAAGATSASVTGLSASTQYFFRVKAVRDTVSSASSNTASATTQAPPVTAPAAPTSLSATAPLPTTVELSWADNASDETGYVVERATNSTFTGATTITRPANSTTLADTGVAAGTAYWYRVKAVKDTLSSAWSNVGTATTPQATPTAPSAPSGLAASATSASAINLTWTDTSNNESGFAVERSTSSTFTSPVTTSVGANTSSLAVTGLSASTQYFFRVRALNQGGSSAFSNTASATTQAAPTPTGYAPTVAADGPVSHWRLGEASGTTAADVLNRNRGTFRNAPMLGRPSLVGDTNTAVGHDGVSDFMDAPDSATLDLASTFTLEAWIKPDVVPAVGGWASIIAKPESYALQFNGPSLELTVIQNGTRRRLLAPAGSIVAGRTYHVVGTYDGVTQRLYINGALVASRAQTGAATNTTWPFHIGAWWGAGEVFRGTIDEVAVYNKTLTAARIQAHHVAGTPAVARAASASRKVRSLAGRPVTRKSVLGPAQVLTKGLKGPGKALRARARSCKTVVAAARKSAPKGKTAKAVTAARKACAAARRTR